MGGNIISNVWNGYRDDIINGLLNLISQKEKLSHSTKCVKQDAFLLIFKSVSPREITCKCNCSTFFVQLFKLGKNCMHWFAPLSNSVWLTPAIECFFFRKLFVKTSSIRRQYILDQRRNQVSRCLIEFVFITVLAIDFIPNGQYKNEI